MSLTHEALRAGFAQLRDATGSGDVAALRAVYEELARVIALHAQQEEQAFFPLLDDRFDGAVAKAGLREAHAQEHALQVELEHALARGDRDAARAAIDAWEGSFERHLVVEEEVMMPLTSAVSPTVAGRAQAVRGIMEVDWEGLKATQLPYVVASLAAHKPYGPLRMFFAAVQLSAGDAYDELEPFIRAALPADKAELLASHGHHGPAT
jgi:hypothetical protein